MRKKIIVGCLLFMIIMLVGCSNTKRKVNVNMETETKSKVVENENLIPDDEIIQAYLKFQKTSLENIKYVKIIKKYGQYGNVVIVLMGRLTFQIPGGLFFPEIKLSIDFPDMNYPLAYKDGNMYELRDAFEKGIVTKEMLFDLKSKIN